MYRTEMEQEWRAPYFTCEEQTVILQRYEGEKKENHIIKGKSSTAAGLVTNSPTVSTPKLFRTRVDVILITHTNPMRSVCCANHVCMTMIVSFPQKRTWEQVKK